MNTLNYLAIMSVVSLATISFVSAEVCSIDNLNDPDICNEKGLESVAVSLGASSIPSETVPMSSMMAPGIIFSQDLKYGVRHDEVLELQRFLNSDSDTVVASYGAGSIGNETNYFGNATRNAVKKFQTKHGIMPVAGYWGPISRAKANELLKEKMEVPVVGGPCEYKTVMGSCNVIKVNEGGDVDFAFTLDEGLNFEGTHLEGSKDIQVSSYPASTLGLGCPMASTPGYPVDLSSCQVKEGAIFSCEMSVITKGTCTPSSYIFKEILR